MNELLGPFPIPVRATSLDIVPKDALVLDAWTQRDEIGNKVMYLFISREDEA